MNPIDEKLARGKKTTANEKLLLAQKKEAMRNAIEKLHNYIMAKKISIAIVESKIVVTPHDISDEERNNIKAEIDILSTNIEIVEKYLKKEKDRNIRKAFDKLRSYVLSNKIKVDVTESGLIMTPLKIETERFDIFKNEIDTIFLDSKTAKEYYERYLYAKEHMKINATIAMRVVKPLNVEKEEFTELVHQIKRTLATIYNDAAINLYQKLKTTKIARGSEGATVKFLMTDTVYHPVMDKIPSSSIALGLCNKLESSFSGGKVWGLREAEITLPQTTYTKIPLIMYRQYGFTITDKDGEFLLEIPFPSYDRLPELKYDKNAYRPWWEKFAFREGSKTTIQLLISTKTRKKRFVKGEVNDDWKENDAVAAQIQRIMDGTYKVTTIEIVERDNNWFIHFSISYDEKRKEPNKNRIGGIHFGSGRPATCVIKDDKYQHVTIYPNTVIAMTKKQMARIREQRIGNRYRKGGHGKVHKLTGTEKLSMDYRQRRRKTMEAWTHTIVNFYRNNNIGIVYLEDISKNQYTFLARYKYPVTELLLRIEKGLQKNGVEVRKQRTYYVNQICSACNHFNKEFTPAFRLKNKFPKFKCVDCLETIYTDMNAAKNVANPDFENILIKTGLLKTKKELENTIVKNIDN